MKDPFLFNKIDVATSMSILNHFQAQSPRAYKCYLPLPAS